MIRIILVAFLALTITGCTPDVSGQLPPPAPTLLLTGTPIHPILTPTTVPSETPQPSPTPVPPVRFAVIGDFGFAGPDLAAVAALVKSWQVEFIITTGDNNYPNGAAATIDENIGQYFHRYISPYQGSYGEDTGNHRFFPSLGNHDWNTEGAQPYLEYFTLPGNERYYQFSWGMVDFFVLDSDWNEPDGISSDSAQADWLQQAMAASTAAWKIVYFHLPPYSSGDHGPTTHMRWPFAEWGADAVLSGHDHNYERLEIDGLTYFVNGLGGGARYNLGKTSPGSIVRYQARHGAMLVEATADQINFSFINVDGDLIDHFSLFQENLRDN